MKSIDGHEVAFYITELQFFSFNGIIPFMLMSV